MDAAKLREILQKEYGIKNEEDFNVAVEKSCGVNLGIFNMPLNERGNDEQETDEQDVA